MLLLIALASAVLWLSLGQTPTRPPTRGRAGPAPSCRRCRVAARAHDGTLVIRVKMSDGSAVSRAPRCGYQRLGGPLRMRAPSPDGTFRFSDAPSRPPGGRRGGEGVSPGQSSVNLDLGVPAETVLTLTPVETDR